MFIYTSLLLIIVLRFSCGERKIWHPKVSKYYEYDCRYRLHDLKEQRLFYKNLKSQRILLLLLKENKNTADM